MRLFLDVLILTGSVGPSGEGPAESQVEGLELGVRSGLESEILELTSGNHPREKPRRKLPH